LPTTYGYDMDSPAPARDHDAGSNDDLMARRRAASEQSRGGSGEAIYAAVAQRLAELSASGDVLDFGAGTGTMTRRLLDSGQFRSVTGADLYPRAADLAPAVTWIEGDLNGSLALPAASFDVVVAAEVIEHLENPRAVCREIFRLLRPNGRVLLSTPNNESWRSIVALVVRGHFVAFGDTSYPAHITALTRSDLSRILQEVGFREISFAFTEEGGIPGLPSRTWQSLLGDRARGLRFSDNVIVTAQKGD
jgi:2-polyprenyl-3-methyl-5-hydroxy-6-metoxy-1,4-benzoquinol methylase